MRNSILTDFEREEKFMETASVIILLIILLIAGVYILLHRFHGQDYDYQHCQRAFDQAFLGGDE
jgi:hypothetical protein